MADIAQDQDVMFMRRAIELAQGRLGQTHDNPAVGCVVVKDGRVIGEAATAPSGRPHAEEQALVRAGESCAGSAVYLTLEPCASRTSGQASCASRLIAARVARVVIACDDASIHAAGQGPRLLREAGITVETGVLKEAAAPLYARYNPCSGRNTERPG